MSLMSAHTKDGQSHIEMSSPISCMLILQQSAWSCLARNERHQDDMHSNVCLMSSVMKSRKKIRRSVQQLEAEKTIYIGSTSVATFCPRSLTLLLSHTCIIDPDLLQVFLFLEK